MPMRSVLGAYSGQPADRVQQQNRFALEGIFIQAGKVVKLRVFAADNIHDLPGGFPTRFFPVGDFMPVEDLLPGAPELFHRVIIAAEMSVADALRV